MKLSSVVCMCLLFPLLIQAFCVAFEKKIWILSIVWGRKGENKQNHLSKSLSLCAKQYIQCRMVANTFLSSSPNVSVILVRAKSRDEIDNFLVSSGLFVEFNEFWWISATLTSLSSPNVSKMKEKHARNK